MARSDRIKPGLIKDRGSAPAFRLDATERKILEMHKYDTNVDEDFNCDLVYDPMNYKVVGSPVAFSSATEPLAEDEFKCRSDKNSLHGHIISTESTGTTEFNLPYISADGLELNVSGEANHITGVEIGLGIHNGVKAAKTIGEDAKFFMEATIKIDDVSDLTELWCGFRKAAAFETDPDDYTDMCAFNIGEDADGQIEIHTILNDASTVNTDTTLADWADGEEKVLRITVDDNGVCSFLVDGSEPTVVPTFTFDSGDVVVPFIAATAETGDPGISVSLLRVGKY